MCYNQFSTTETFSFRLCSLCKREPRKTCCNCLLNERDFGGKTSLLLCFYMHKIQTSHRLTVAVPIVRLFITDGIFHDGGLPTKSNA